MMERISLKVEDGSEMSCVVSRPSLKGPHPGLIVFQEAFGVNRHIQKLTKRFADNGFVAIAPEIYHRTAPVGFTVDYGQFESVVPHYSAVTLETVRQDAEACMNWLMKEEGAPTVSAVGYCLGGRVAYMANAFLPLNRGVSYYGGRIQNHLDLVPLQKAPLLFFWGGKDKHIPPGQIAEITGALREAQRDFTSVEISEADHGFFCEDRAAFHPKAARESWALLLEFLK